MGVSTEFAWVLLSWGRRKSGWQLKEEGMSFRRAGLCAEELIQGAEGCGQHSHVFRPPQWHP